MNGRADIEALFPLSPLQEGLLFHSLRSPGSQAYFGQQSYQIEGSVNAANLRKAWQRVIDRHSVLRTAFIWDGVERMTQAVFRHAEPRWNYSDWSDIPAPDHGQRLAEFLEEDRSQGIDVSQAPLLRLHLIRLTDSVHYFVISQHHLILDGWSYGLVLKEMMAQYQSLQAGTALDLPAAPPYRDYVDWLANQESWRAEEFWRTRLKGFRYPTELPFMQPTAISGEYREARWELSQNETVQLDSFARGNMVTLNTVVQGAWALLLSRFAAQDTVFGAATTVRPPSLPGSQVMVGPLMNTLPVRARFKDYDRLRDLFARLQEHQVEAQNHAFPSLIQMQGWSEVERGQALFDSIVVVENYPVNIFEEVYGADWAGSLKIRPLHGFARTHYPLTLHVLGKSPIIFEFVYDCGGFSAEAIHLLIGQFRIFIEAIVTDPDCRISELPAMSREDRAGVLACSTGDRKQSANANRMNEMICKQARRTPDAVAVEVGTQTFTYNDLEKRTNQLARYLLSMGVAPEVRVVIHLERGWHAIVAILAVLEAGAVFIPTDTGAPKDRLNFIFLDAHPAVILTSSHLADRLPSDSTLTICVDEAWDEIVSQSNEPLPKSIVDGDNLAYVLFTSGSTGRPKGVGVTHRGLANYIEWAMDAYDIQHGIGAPLHSSLGFDLTITSLFAPLATGGRLIVLPEQRNLTALADTVFSGQEYSFVKLTPSHLRALNEMRTNVSGGSMNARALILGGEQLVFEDLKAWKGTNQPRIFNEYGPTETVVGCAVYEVSFSQSGTNSVPVGRPIANTEVYVLTPSGELAPPGISGELHIGGTGLARGYLNDYELTSEKFIPNPFSRTPGARLYRTGDQARWLPSRQLEYLGRFDRQLKIRGYRIEPGEIEAVIAGHSEVQSCAVVARAQENNPELRLVCYVIPRSDQLAIYQLSEWARDRLPDYMVPSIFVMLAEFPLTENGKLDRRALPTPDWKDSGSGDKCDPPITDTERELATLWQEILGRENVGRNENFFQIGGHSLLATQLVSRVHTVLRVPIPLHLAFEAPTIAEFAEQIEKFRSEAGSGAQKPEFSPISARIPSLPVNLDNLSNEEIEEYLARLQDIEA